MRLLSAMIHPTAEMISNTIDRIGFASIFTTVGINAGVQAEAIEITTTWAMADYALLISMIGGVTFIANNIFNMYLAWKKRKSDEDKS